MTRADAGGLRERHKQSTRRALVDAALQLFTQRGYGHVTIEDVCAAVGVSPRTFFRYFPSKEYVLAEPIADVLREIRESLAAQPLQGTVWQALRTSLMSGVAVIEDRRQEFLRCSEVIRERPSALASSARALVEWEEAVRDEVAQRLSVDPATMSARLMLGTTMLALRAALDLWADGGGAEPVRDLVETALDAVEPGARALETAAKSRGAKH